MASDAPEGAEPLVQLRKVNCVQGWMDEKAGKELDNCEELELTREDIGTLLDDIFEAVYRNGDRLEPKGGFFFGAYEKDPGYWFTLGTTYEELRVLYVGMDDDETVKYHGWW
jgi:hypothetical protein